MRFIVLLARRPRIGVNSSFTTTKVTRYFLLFFGLVIITLDEPTGLSLLPVYDFSIIFVGTASAFFGLYFMGNMFTDDPESI